MYSVEQIKKAMKGGRGCTFIDISVAPGARKTQIPSGFNEWRNTIEIKIKSQAKEGKANTEIIKKMEKIFDARVEIIKGLKSTSKTLKVYKDYGEVLKTLLKRFEEL